VSTSTDQDHERPGLWPGRSSSAANATSPPLCQCEDVAVPRRRSKSSGFAAKVTQSSVGPAGQSDVWPRPVYDGTWVDAEGTAWRMRGSALDAKGARKLMRRSDVRVVLAYSLEVAEVLGAERDDLLSRVEEFLQGRAAVHSRFEMGDFRDPQRRVMLLVQESC
jgi:hypothetical protein